MIYEISNGVTEPNINAKIYFEDDNNTSYYLLFLRPCCVDLN